MLRRKTITHRQDSSLNQSSKATYLATIECWAAYTKVTVGSVFPSQ